MTAPSGAGEESHTPTISRDDLLTLNLQVRSEADKLRYDADYLLHLLADVAAKATPYGEQDGGFVATYILPTGPIHRILAALGEHGRSVPLLPGLPPEPPAPSGAGEIDRTRNAVAGEAYRLTARWQQLTAEQQDEVIDWLSHRRPDAFAFALDGEERTRPDDDD